MVHGLMIVQRRGALHLWPREEVARIRREFGGRLEVLHASGLVAHRIGDPQEWAGWPFAWLDPDTLVNPDLVTRDGQDLKLPGGWRHPAGPDLVPPPPEPAREESRLGGEGPFPSEVLWLERVRGRWRWVTPRGACAWPGTLDEALEAHGGLARAGLRHVNPGRIRRIEADRDGGRLSFDGGEELRVARDGARQLAEDLGLENLREVGRQSEAQRWMFRLMLQDWPQEFLDADDAWLRSEFSEDPDRLLANLIWQTFRLRSAGRAEDHGQDHRGLWYLPVAPVLARAGLEEAPVLLQMAEGRAATLWRRFLDLLDTMVGEARLMTFRELGFDPKRADARGVGTRIPTVVVMAEKGSLRLELEVLVKRFGVSWIILGGQPSLFGTENLVAELEQVIGDAPILLVAYVDFDPYGWMMADAFVEQAARYGLTVEGVRFLVRPSRFSAAELRRVAIPLQPRGPGGPTVLRRWLKRSGGVDGRARGIYADALRPAERVVEAFQQETGLEGVA